MEWNNNTKMSLARLPIHHTRERICKLKSNGHNIVSIEERRDKEERSVRENEIMWRSAYDTADVDHENQFKPYEYDLRKCELQQNTIEHEKWTIEFNGYRAYSLSDTHNPHMLTRIIFENKNKITTIIVKKNDNNF